MNILFVNDLPFNPVAGGIERVTDLLSKEFLKRGCSVFFLCGRVAGNKRYLFQYAFPAQIYELPYDGLFTNNENVDYYRCLLRKLKIDIVINQRGLNGWFNKQPMVSNVKSIGVIHSSPDANINKILLNLLNSTRPSFLGIKRLIKRFLYPIIYLYWKRRLTLDTRNQYKELFSCHDAIVVLAKEDIKKLECLVNNDKNVRILNIANPNTFTTNYPFTHKKDKIILYVGRLTSGEKNPLRLLRIWNILYNKHPDWNLVIVGDGDERTNIKKYIRCNNISNVYLEGEQKDVARFYIRSSFVCLTSNVEGWGMTLTEGMQYGCIPFTFNNYGAAYEIIDDGINGCLVPAFDIKMYASRLSELMVDKEKRLRMSKAAMEKVQMFSVDRIVDKWVELFKSMQS